MVGRYSFYSLKFNNSEIDRLKASASWHRFVYLISALPLSISLIVRRETDEISSKFSWLKNSNSGDTDVPYKTLDGKTDALSPLFDDGQIALQNGSLLLFENNIIEQRVYVSVDLNGYNNKPNRWGYDLFTFQLKDGELKTMGAKGTDYPDVDACCDRNGGCGKLNGISCAQKAKENPLEYFKDVVKTVK